VLMQIASTNRITSYQLNGLNTMREFISLGTSAFVGLVGAATSLGSRFGMAMGLGFLAFGLASSAAFASSIYARSICRHYHVPNGTGSEKVMFPESVISRFGGATGPAGPPHPSNTVARHELAEADHAAPLRGGIEGGEQADKAVADLQGHGPPEPPRPPVPAPRAGVARWLAIGGGLIALLLSGGVGVFYLLRELGLDQQANAWYVNVDGTASSASLTLVIHGAPAGGRITVLGKEHSCDDPCRIELSRREVEAGRAEIRVTLHWRERRVWKSVERKLFNPLVSFESSAAKQTSFCDIQIGTSFGLTHAYLGSEHGLTLRAQGELGDTVSIGGRSPDEPAHGKDYSFSEDDLLGMLALSPAHAGVHRIKIVLPLSVQSSDGVEWRGEISCDAEILRGYLNAEFKASRLSARASSTPTAGALVLGDALFFVGDGSSPWDAQIVATVDRSEIGSRKCDYGGYLSHEADISYHWYAHQIRTQKLRTGASTGTKRFTTTMGSWTCPDNAVFGIGKNSRSEDIVPSAAEEAEWLTSLVTR
jgi:hypothetical protein